MNSILILIHCESNAGYAIAPLERTFFKMALQLCGQDPARIHFGYQNMDNGAPRSLPADFRNYLVIDTHSEEPAHVRRVVDYMRQHSIDTVFGFDQPVARPLYKHLRHAGMRHFISYWGAPMSSLWPFYKLLLKRIEVALRRHGPDHYIFESQGMADTAVLGRGIPRSRTSVVYLGVDTSQYRPDPAAAGYVREQLSIAPNRRIFYYAGHMEARKGVAVIIRAANLLAERRALDDWQIVLFGNRPGEELGFVEMLTPKAREHVKFGGYRNDLPLIQRGCYAGIIASTGWDSLTMSSMEIQASGMPLLASALPGLREAVADGESGLLFPPGDAAALCELMVKLLDDGALRDSLGSGARRRVENRFSAEAQLRGLTQIVAKCVA
jgi:glycosyltransferase involved in cell wall biosynthesis